MFACFTYQLGVRGVENIGLYPLKIPMNDPEPVKVCHTRHDLRELKVVDDEGKTVKKEGKKNSKRTHHSQTVRLWIGSRILHHIPVGHPLGENEEGATVWGH